MQPPFFALLCFHCTLIWCMLAFLSEEEGMTESVEALGPFCWYLEWG